MPFPKQVPPSAPIGGTQTATLNSLPWAGGSASYTPAFSPGPAWALFPDAPSYSGYILPVLFDCELSLSGEGRRMFHLHTTSVIDCAGRDCSPWPVRELFLS